jgi:hypothetical protein
MAIYSSQAALHQDADALTCRAGLRPRECSFIMIVDVRFASWHFSWLDSDEHLCS